MATYVYFIEALGLPEPMTKIGISEDPEGRLYTLQTGCPVPLSLTGYFQGTWRDERRVHQAYAEHRQHGEWFKLRFSPEGVKEIAKWVGLSKEEYALRNHHRARRAAASFGMANPTPQEAAWALEQSELRAVALRKADIEEKKLGELLIAESPIQGIPDLPADPDTQQASTEPTTEDPA